MSAWCFALHAYVSYRRTLTMFMWNTIVNSLSQVADHPMSSPCWVDRAGPVLAYRTMHLSDVAPASPMISLLDIIPGIIVLHTPGLSGRYTSNW